MLTRSALSLRMTSNSRSFLLFSDFFALLAAEHQHHFGDNDPQVAVALNMLTASLIQAGDFEKAERVIGKASKLGKGEDQETTYELLEILREERLK